MTDGERLYAIPTTQRTGQFFSSFRLPATDGCKITEIQSLEHTVKKNSVETHASMVRVKAKIMIRIDYQNEIIVYITRTRLDIIRTNSKCR